MDEEVGVECRIRERGCECTGGKATRKVRRYREKVRRETRVDDEDAQDDGSSQERDVNSMVATL